MHRSGDPWLRSFTQNILKWICWESPPVSLYQRVKSFCALYEEEMDLCKTNFYYGSDSEQCMWKKLKSVASLRLFCLVVLPRYMYCGRDSSQGRISEKGWTIATDLHPYAGTPHQWTVDSKPFFVNSRLTFQRTVLFLIKHFTILTCRLDIIMVPGHQVEMVTYINRSWADMPYKSYPRERNQTNSTTARKLYIHPYAK